MEEISTRFEVVEQLAFLQECRLIVIREDVLEQNVRANEVAQNRAQVVVGPADAIEAEPSAGVDAAQRENTGRTLPDGQINSFHAQSVGPIQSG